MAATGRRTAPPVAEQLYAKPYRFEFFQAVHLLEQMAQPKSHEPLHRSIWVKFRSSLKSDFPASEIDALTPGKSGTPPEMTVNFLGLGGAFGPLPPPVTEQLLARSRRGDTAGRDFLDIFNDRLVRLFYHARAKHRPELSRGTPAESNFAAYLFSLIGLGSPALHRRLAFPERALLHYAGILAGAPRSLHGLARLLSGYFGIAVSEIRAGGRWLELDASEQMRLGQSGHNARLGGEAVLGRRVWNEQSTIRIALGPLTLAQFKSLLPDGTAHRQLADLVGFYLGTPLVPEYRLLLDPGEIPQARLGASHGTKLGWLSFLAGKQPAAPGEIRVSSPRQMANAWSR